jgi:(p)ppGpp synthase/HD superfamily hydrolase
MLQGILRRCGHTYSHRLTFFVVKLVRGEERVDARLELPQKLNLQAKNLRTLHVRVVQQLVVLLVKIGDLSLHRGVEQKCNG